MADPVLTFAPDSGMAITKFTIAVDRFKKGEADFIRCISFNKTAETVANYIVKGSQIALEGHIQTGSYEKDGKKIFTTDVIVDRFDFCGKSEGKSEAKTEKPSDKYRDEGITPFDEDEGSIPF